MPKLPIISGIEAIKAFSKAAGLLRNTIEESKTTGYLKKRQKNVIYSVFSPGIKIQPRRLYHIRIAYCDIKSPTAI